MPTLGGMSSGQSGGAGPQQHPQEGVPLDLSNPLSALPGLPQVMLRGPPRPGVSSGVRVSIPAYR